MSNPIDLVKNYMSGTKAIPLPPNTQAEAELYNSENEKEIDGQTESQTKLAIEINKDLENAERKRRYDAEKELYESNQQEAEREMEEYNSQRELDDLDEDNYLQDDEFSGNYFAQPDESEQKESLGNKIRAKYDSFKASASDTAESLASSFGAAAGVASAKASAEYSRFKKGDPIFSVQSPVRRGKNPYSRRTISRPGRSISRPYNGGRFGDDFSLGTNGTNPYYPVADAGRQSVSAQPTMDMYLPSGGAVYEGEFSGRKAFKREFSDERESYDPFGYGGLSGDGFNNTGSFGSSLMSFGGDNSIFGGMSAGTDPVFGDGAMFNANRAKGSKKEVNGFNLDLIIGDNGGMYNTSDPSPRKTTKRKSTTRKSAKKVSKAKPTKRKPTTRKQASSIAFALP